MSAHVVSVRWRPLANRRGWFWFCQTCITASERDDHVKQTAYDLAESHSIKGLHNATPKVEVEL